MGANVVAHLGRRTPSRRRPHHGLAQLSATVQAMQLYNERMEESLLRIGAIDEDRLLRFAAERCRTQFVSTAKLARLPGHRAGAAPGARARGRQAVGVSGALRTRHRHAQRGLPRRRRSRIQEAALDRDPRARGQVLHRSSRGRDGRHRQVVPRRDQPFRLAGLRRLHAGQLVRGAPRTRARRTGGATRRARGPSAGRVLHDPTANGGLSPCHAPPRRVSFAARAPGVAAGPRGSATASSDARSGVAAKRSHAATNLPPGGAALRTRPPKNLTPPPNPFEAPRPASTLPGAPARLPTREPPAPSAPVSVPPASRFRSSLFPGAQSEPGDKRLTDLAELLNVLVTLNENSRDEFRGHSASVSRLSKMMTERMGLGETEQLNATIAANLHDSGKPISYHLTGLNVAQYDTHRRAALKLAYTPQRLVESVGLPMDATTAVSTMYERFDGTGFPGRISGKQIPLGARVLSLCDTYSDLHAQPAQPVSKRALPRGGEQGPDRTRGHVVRPRFRRIPGAVGRGRRPAAPAGRRQAAGADCGAGRGGGDDPRASPDGTGLRREGHAHGRSGRQGRRGGQRALRALRGRASALRRLRSLAAAPARERDPKPCRSCSSRRTPTPRRSTGPSLWALRTTS